VPYEGLDPKAAQLYEGVFDSTYNALQVSLTKRFGRGFQLTNAYTFSKALDDLSQNSGPFLSAGAVLGDQRNFAQNKGPSDYDRRQRWVSSFLWQLPGGRWGARPLRTLTRDWEVAGLLTLQSGSALTIGDSVAGTIYGSIPSRAQFAPGYAPGNIATPGGVESRLNAWFNPNAFTTAPAIGDGTGFGNSGRGILAGPGQRNLDFTLLRAFPVHPLGEAGRLQFRADAFNAFNTPNFGNPGVNRAAAPSFGRITGTTVNPRVMQFSMKLSF